MVLVPVKMEDIKSLQDAILSLHGCESTWVESVAVHETVWAGRVDVFQLQGHPEAETAYGATSWTKTPAGGSSMPSWGSRQSTQPWMR